MKTGRYFCIVMLFAVVALSAGCISSGSHAVGVEPSAKFMASYDYEVLGEAEGVSSSFRLFWFFPVTPGSTNSEAVDNAVRSKGGDNLIEAVYSAESKVYIIGTVNNIFVKGKVIRYIRRE